MVVLENFIIIEQNYYDQGKNGDVSFEYSNY